MISAENLLFGTLPDENSCLWWRKVPRSSGGGLLLLSGKHRKFLGHLDPKVPQSWTCIFVIDKYYKRKIGRHNRVIVLLAPENSNWDVCTEDSPLPGNLPQREAPVRVASILDGRVSIATPVYRSAEGRKPLCVVRFEAKDAWISESVGGFLYAFGQSNGLERIRTRGTRARSNR